MSDQIGRKEELMMLTPIEVIEMLVRGHMTLQAMIEDSDGLAVLRNEKYLLLNQLMGTLGQFCPHTNLVGMSAIVARMKVPSGERFYTCCICRRAFEEKPLPDLMWGTVCKVGNGVEIDVRLEESHEQQ